MATPGKRTGEGETTYLNTEQRVLMAEQMLCEQYTSKQIVDELCQVFGIVERTAYTTLKIAYDRLAEDAATDRGLRKAKARATWQAQYRRCVSKGDLAAANYAMDRLCRLDGLFAAEKHIHTTTTISVSVRIDAVVNVLDAAGLAALDVVLAQLEAAKARGELADPDPDDDEPLALPEGDAADEVLARDGKPVPIPAKGRGRKPRAKA